MPTVVHSHAAQPIEARAVHVALGDRAYDVLIGPRLLEQTGRLIATRLGKGRCGVVTDENVAKHHLATVEAALKTEARHKGSIVLPAGEASKSFSQLAPLCEQLLAMGLERGDFVVALGGGVMGDLAGFAASILRRGVRLVQIPTSLLAQVDSSVGGKTGINTPQGKNLIGTFHQPSLVLADTDVLQTLTDRHMRAGYAEVAKYGLLGDADFFTWLEDHHAGVFGNDLAALTKAIETSVAAKADIVVRDEKEAGDRALLNLGHTFGHALEAWTGYSDRLLHGEGVSIGMCLALQFSENLGYAPAGTAERAEAHLKAVGLPTRISDIPGDDEADVEMLVDIMGQDKKVRDGELTFVLARAIGDTFVAKDVDRNAVCKFLSQVLASRA
ncbi:MAG: 3-dehydroquinate synthase [Hyphomicrobiaceae bacterium]